MLQAYNGFYMRTSSVPNFILLAVCGGLIIVVGLATFISKDITSPYSGFLFCSPNHLDSNETRGIDVISFDNFSDHEYRFVARITNTTDEAFRLNEGWRLGAWAGFFCAWAYADSSTTDVILSLEDHSLDGKLLAPSESIIVHGRILYHYSYLPGFCRNEADVRLELYGINMEPRFPIPVLVSQANVCDVGK